MSHPSRPTVIAENQTGSAVSLPDLGAEVPASSSLTLSTFYYLHEIQGSLDLLLKIQDDSLLINDGTTTLSKTASIQFVTGVASAQNLQNGVTGPASAVANQIPKFGDTTGKALVASPLTINGSNQLDMGGAKIINGAAPDSSTDFATKGYVDSLISGIDVKPSVRAATTGSITLSGPQTIDGVSVIAGNRVLVKDQGSSANGIYVVAAGAWSRATDMAVGLTAAGAFTIVEEGTTNADVGFVCTNNAGADVVGTDTLTFARFSTFQLASVAPENVTKAAAAVGTSSRAAREDHKHDIATAAPAAGAVAIGNAAAEGTSTSLARADHTHAVSSAAPVAVGTANSEGVATTFARSDHVHNTPFSAVNAALGAATASISVNNQKITSLATPTAGTDAANKDYVDGAVTGGSDWKNSVRAATTGSNITLSGPQTIDSVSVIAGDRVLVKDQSTGSQNGIYVVAAGAWSRATDADSSAKVTSGLTVIVTEGTTLAGTSWTLTTADPITLGTTALVFNASQLNTTAPQNVTKAAASAGTSPFAARLDHKHDIATAAPGTTGVGTTSSEGTSTSVARADHVHQSNTAPVNVTKAAAAIGTSGEPARADHKHDIATAAPGTTGVGTTSSEGTSTSVARADHVHQSNTAPVNVTKAAAAIGTSGEPARADHKHDISTAAPTQGIGGGNSEGTSTSVARADHNHALRETSGPTDLTIAGISDGEVLRRTGTTVAGGAGKLYPASTTDPSSPTPAAGDRYFNTNLQMWMVYDGSRSKFLSEETVIFDFGRNGSTAVGAYYRGVDSKVLSSTAGFHAFFNGTIVGLSYSRSDSDASTFQVDANGVSAATLASSAVSGRSTSLNGNFNAGDIIAVKNAGANITDNVQGSVKIKWRA